jgi:hypothetical protein
VCSNAARALCSCLTATQHDCIRPTAGTVFSSNRSRFGGAEITSVTDRAFPASYIYRIREMRIRLNTGEMRLLSDFLKIGGVSMNKSSIGFSAARFFSEEIIMMLN